MEEIIKEIKLKCPHCGKLVYRIPEDDLTRKRTGRKYQLHFFEEHPPVTTEMGSSGCWKIHQCKRMENKT